MPSPADISFAILAGGKGRRLGGVAKGQLRVDGRSILDRLLELGEGYGERLVVGEAAPLGIRQVWDVVPNQGAPGGVHAALCGAGKPWVLVVACDMPFVHPLALELLGQTEGGCFEHQGRLEPLLGLYPASLERHFRQALRAVRAPALAEILAGCRWTRLSAELLKGVDPELSTFANLNNPADLARWGAQKPA